MRKLTVLSFIALIGCALVVTACRQGAEPEVKPAELQLVQPQPFAVNVSVPTAKRNTDLVLTVNLSTEYTVTNVRFKQGSHEKYAVLSSLSGAQDATATYDNKNWTFTISQNGKYTVAAEDSLGRTSFTEIEVNCFDYEGPENVSDLTADYDEANKQVTISWTNPTDEDFSYTELYLAEGWFEASNLVAKFESGETSYTIDVTDDTVPIYKIFIYAVDVLENKNNGIFIQLPISQTDGYIYAPLSEGTDGSAGTTATYVTFGLWPQTVLPENSAVQINENKSQTAGLFTYYAGSDGNCYVKQEEKAHNIGYKYSDDSDVKQASENSTRYFKVEPIKWRVLEEKDGKKFLLAENCLMAVQYYDNTNARTIGGSTIFSNNYMHSKIRAFLNGYKYQLGTADNADYEIKGFLQTAFTSEAQAKIATTTVDNSVESAHGSSWNSYVCDDTSDKVFLLSAKEATTASYGFSTSINADNPRIRKPTDFALATGAFNSGGAIGGVWWLRSPDSGYGYYARYINHDGYVDNYGVAWGGGAVVPAIWVTP